MEGQCSIAQFLGQPGARLMNISFILKYFKSYWDVRKHMISKDTEYPKTTRYKKEINYRLTKSPRYRGFVLMLQHLRFFPLASSSSGWFFGVSSLSPFHHIGFLCLFLLMKLWHPQQIFYKSSELNQKTKGSWSKVWFLFKSVSMLTIKLSQQGRTIRMSITQPSGILLICAKKSRLYLAQILSRIYAG